MAKFDFNDIEEAFYFVNSTPNGENRAIVCKDKGSILYQSDLSELDEIGEDEESEDWIDVPEKQDLDLGQQVVWAFVADHIPKEYGRVRAMFRGPGAYRRFKDFLDDKGLLQAWYDFDAQCQEKALREWCRENGIELND